MKFEMNRSAALILLQAVVAVPPAPLVLERTIQLPDVSGRIDHLDVDLGRKHLFVAELGNGTIDIVDLERADGGCADPGLKEPQGVAYVPAADRLAVASGGDGTVRIFAPEIWRRGRGSTRG